MAGGPWARPPLTSGTVVPQAPTPPAPRRGWPDAATARGRPGDLGRRGRRRAAAGERARLAGRRGRPRRGPGRGAGAGRRPAPAAAAGAGALPPLALVLDRAAARGHRRPPAGRAGQPADRGRPGRPRSAPPGRAGLGAPAAGRRRERRVRLPGGPPARPGRRRRPGRARDERGRRAAARRRSRGPPPAWTELARENPDDQLVAFNQGWVEIYRRRAVPAERAWRRAVALGAETRLGQTAAALLETARGRRAARERSTGTSSGPHGGLTRA